VLQWVRFFDEIGHFYSEAGHICAVWDGTVPKHLGVRSVGQIEVLTTQVLNRDDQKKLAKTKQTDEMIYTLIM